MSLLQKVYPVIISIILLFVACDDSAVRSPAPTQAAVATRNPLLATPRPAPVDEPLATQIPDSASTFSVVSTISKQMLATSLSTTVDALEWFNPGLSDPVLAGTIVAIPRQYHAGQDETLASIAEQLGLAVELLMVVNPILSTNTPLPEGTLVTVPKLYNVPEEVTLDRVAITLHVSVQALQAVNPGLADKATVPANTLLVIPPVESAVQQ